ncbi:MAG: phosphate signaling complex protein PhoU [Erysipelotrichaceae bacterium]|nr:phosphate signaling complex protein PhoU [Erysipelotrichaceae bacterium]
MRKVFDQELEKLGTDLVKMCGLAENAIENMNEAFKDQNKTLAKEVIENDRLINDMERTIESRAFNLTLRQQPIASDLRNITTALKVVTDLERIGDQAAEICELLLYMDGEHATYRTVEHIPTMAKKTRIMVHEAIDAFIKQDLTAAKMVVKMDDEVDALFNEVKMEIVEIMKQSNEDIDTCISFLMIAKYLEKIGDHAVNTCEWLEFRETGAVNNKRII